MAIPLPLVAVSTGLDLWAWTNATPAMVGAYAQVVDCAVTSALIGAYVGWYD